MVLKAQSFALKFANNSAVANLPAEITHLYEEMEAKEDLIQEKRKTINNLDGSIQKFVKLHGSLVQNPKEEQWSKQVLDLYDQCKVLQAEKLGLAEKAVQLVSIPSASDMSH